MIKDVEKAVVETGELFDRFVAVMAGKPDVGNLVPFCFFQTAVLGEQLWQLAHSLPEEDFVDLSPAEQAVVMIARHSLALADWGDEPDFRAYAIMVFLLCPFADSMVADASIGAVQEVDEQWPVITRQYLHDGNDTGGGVDFFRSDDGDWYLDISSFLNLATLCLNGFCDDQYAEDVAGFRQHIAKYIDAPSIDALMQPLTSTS